MTWFFLIFTCLPHHLSTVGQDEYSSLYSSPSPSYLRTLPSLWLPLFVGTTGVGHKQLRVGGTSGSTTPGLVCPFVRICTLSELIYGNLLLATTLPHSRRPHRVYGSCVSLRNDPSIDWCSGSEIDSRREPGTLHDPRLRGLRRETVTTYTSSPEHTIVWGTG